MASVEKSVEVDVPVSTAYNQWTQFEEFPRFMEGVESVTQLDDTHIKWVAEIAGQKREWESEITEQIPDNRIAWTAREGAQNSGVVTFHRIDDNKSKVMLQLEFDPEGIVEQVGDKLGLVGVRASGDLKRFKEFIEQRGTETGAWRGEVEAPGS
ncbi:MAG TPA: SRPBCC family protein [Actinomycetota bacterium]|nr:SRPBCC family protein [Actinomycetota bacterium]